MKKLITILGLALLTALLITGCQKEPAWEDDVTEDATAVELTNGTWEYTESIITEGDYKKDYLGSMDEDELADMPQSFKDLSGKVAITIKTVYTIKVADETVTLESRKDIYAVKYPEAAEKKILENTVAAYKKDLEPGEDVSLSGTTITFTTTYPEESIKGWQTTKEDVLSEFTDLSVKTNKKHTKYMYSASVDQNGAKVSYKKTLSKK